MSSSPMDGSAAASSHSPGRSKRKEYGSHSASSSPVPALSLSAISPELSSDWKHLHEPALVFDEIYAFHRSLKSMPIPPPQQQPHATTATSSTAAAPAVPAASVSGAPSDEQHGSRRHAHKHHRQRQRQTTDAASIDTELTPEYRILIDSADDRADAVATADADSAESRQPQSELSRLLTSITRSLSSSSAVAISHSLSSVAYIELAERRKQSLNHSYFVVRSAEKPILEAIKPRTEKASTSTSATGDANKKSSSKPKPSLSLSPSTSSASPLVRMTVMSLFPIVRSLSQNDATLLPSILRVLLDIVTSMPLLSLASEPNDCIDAFRVMINDMCSNPKQQPQIIAQAVSALIALALHQGRLQHILTAVNLILQLHMVTAPFTTQSLPPTSNSLDTTPLSLAPIIDQVSSYRDDYDLPLLDSDSYIGSWQHHSADINVFPPQRINHDLPQYNKHSDPLQMVVASSSSSSSQSSLLTAFDLAFLGAIATDGTFLYVINHHGLYRIGSGFNGTIKGHIYAANTHFHSEIAQIAKSIISSSMTAATSKTDSKLAQTTSTAPSQSPTQRKPAGAPATSLPVSSTSSSTSASTSSTDKDTARSGALAFVDGRLFFAAPNHELIAAAVGSSSSVVASLHLLDHSVIREIDVVTLSECGAIKVSHNRATLPMYQSICSDSHLLYGLYASDQAKKRKSSHRSSAISSSAQSAALKPPTMLDVYSLHMDKRTFVLERTITLEDASSVDLQSLYQTATLSSSSPSSSSHNAPLPIPYKSFCTGQHFVRMACTPSSRSNSYSVSVHGGDGTTMRQDIFNVSDGKLVYRPSTSSIVNVNNVSRSPRHNLLLRCRQQHHLLVSADNVSHPIMEESRC